MRWITGALVVAAAAVTSAVAAPESFVPEAPAQATPKQAVREVQPSGAPGRAGGVEDAGAVQRPSDQIVNLSEMEELRAELRALKQENAELKRKVDELSAGGGGGGGAAAAKGQAGKPLAPKAAAAAAVAPRRKSYTQIEIGMTRQDVDQFIRSHKNLRLVGVSANSGVTQHEEETVVRREGNRGSSVVNRLGRADSANLGPGTLNEAQEADATEEHQTVQRKFRSGKKEIITVAQLVPRQVVKGQQRNSLGKSTPVYGTTWEDGGRLRIEMTDDIVTAVDGIQY